MDVEGVIPSGSARLIESVDHTRGSTEPPFGPRAHKEWHHFVVFGRSVEVLVNFSCCDRFPEIAGWQRELPRLVLLVRRDQWEGGIENFDREEASIDHGRIRFDLASNRLEFRDGRFYIDAGLREHRIRVRLVLSPRTKPVFVPSTPMRDGPPLHWVVVPRLVADGSVWIDRRELPIERAAAYHDHNWGHFLWGHDLSWEWGFVLPDDADDPRCLVFVRLTDRARSTALDHKLLLWHGSSLWRSFREGQIETNISLDVFRPESLMRVPAPMGMLVPGRCADLPARFSMRAREGEDWVTLESRPYDALQVLVPNETDLGLTVFNELSARVDVEGCFGQEPFRFSGRSMMELIRHV